MRNYDFLYDLSRHITLLLKPFVCHPREKCLVSLWGLKSGLDYRFVQCDSVCVLAAHLSYIRYQYYQILTVMIKKRWTDALVVPL